MSNRSGSEIPVPPKFYRPLRWYRERFARNRGDYRLVALARCGGCRREFTSLRVWEAHWSKTHGHRLEIQRTLTALQRGITSWARIRDPVRRREAKYSIERRRNSYRVGLWYSSHPDVRRRMEKTKLSHTDEARYARKMRQRWRSTKLHCGICGAEIRRREIRPELGDGIAGAPVGWVSICPTDGFAWTWTDRELFLIAAPRWAKSRATRIAKGGYTPGALKAWVTRRERGHVAEDVRKLWRTRRAMYGPTGISVDGAASIAAANRANQVKNWGDPIYRERQTAAIRAGIGRGRM